MGYGMRCRRSGRRNMSPKILPTVLMIIDLCAAVPYYLQGDWRKGTYWVAAFVLTYVVTW